ncbi:MAG: VWA domain-containing protein [Candidatus Obscuribacterales bacterium]
MSTGQEELEERLRRWRLLLGSQDKEGLKHSLEGEDAAIDATLSSLYNPREDDGGMRGADLGSSSPNVARWLGDIRKYFPESVVTIMQKDALEKLNLKRMLLEPELLSSMVPDVNLVATLVALGSAMPNKTKETARMVVRKVVDQLMAKLANPTRQAIVGATNRATKNYRPRHHEINWARTIQINLKHYQPRLKTIIPQRIVGYGRKRSSLKDIILLVDQSGSMATSVVYSSIFGAVLASLPAVSTQLVVFDTAIVDLTEKLADPVDVIFGTQLGGGTDINRAVAYAQTLVKRPSDTILVLVSDLFEGGNNQEMLKRIYSLVNAGVTVVALLALTDQGAPAFDHRNAAHFCQMGVPAFACTPDQFPQLMAVAINRGDLTSWAAAQGIVTTRAEESEV